MNNKFQKYILFPIKYDNLFKLYKKHINMFWTVEEIDIYSDLKDWEKLNDNEKFYIKNVLAFFASSDAIVMDNIYNFIQDCEIAEAKSFYSIQSFIESIHNETYNMFIDVLIKDKNEKLDLFNALENNKSIKEKSNFCFKYMDKNVNKLFNLNDNKTINFIIRLIAFICIEGIFFSSSFAAIFWLKKRNLMHGLTFSNELISRDEGLHVIFGCELLKILCDKNNINLNELKDIINKIFNEAVKLESYFVKKSLPVDLIGLNSKTMKKYIKFVADYILSNLINLPKIYNISNPFEWMEMISLQGKTNFFEKRVSEYQKSNNKLNDFDINQDF
jgi:ribonucleoside-diphosphate reductase subunit M2